MYLRYQDFLQSKFSATLTLFVVACIIAITTFFIIFLVLRPKTKKEKAISFLTVAVFLAVGVLFVTHFVIPHQKDIRDQSYVEYSGELTVEDVYFSRGNGMRVIVCIENDKRMQLECYTDMQISLGTYNVKMLYSEHTKYLFEFEIVD